MFAWQECSDHVQFHNASEFFHRVFSDWSFDWACSASCVNKKVQALESIVHGCHHARDLILLRYVTRYGLTLGFWVHLDKMGGMLVQCCFVSSD